MGNGNKFGETQKSTFSFFLTLTEKAREAVLEINATDLNKDDGMEKLYTKLDSLFQEDSNQAALSAYDTFDRYLRPKDMSVKDFLITFEQMTTKLKEDHKITLPEPVLAYRALRSANLCEENERLIRATVSDLTGCHVHSTQESSWKHHS